MELKMKTQSRWVNLKSESCLLKVYISMTAVMLNFLNAIIRGQSRVSLIIKSWLWKNMPESVMLVAFGEGGRVRIREESEEVRNFICIVTLFP